MQSGTSDSRANEGQLDGRIDIPGVAQSADGWQPITGLNTDDDTAQQPAGMETDDSTPQQPAGMGTEDDSTKRPEIAKNHNSGGRGCAGQGVQTNVRSDTRDSPRRDRLPADSLCHDPQQSPSPTQDLHHHTRNMLILPLTNAMVKGKPHRNRTVDRPRRMEQTNTQRRKTSEEGRPRQSRRLRETVRPPERLM